MYTESLTGAFHADVCTFDIGAERIGFFIDHGSDECGIDGIIFGIVEEFGKWNQDDVIIFFGTGELT